MRKEECVQYVGDSGITAYCQVAVTRLLQHGDRIQRAVILTSDSAHGLLLFVEPSQVIAVRPGFASGYDGEAPRRFSYVLQLLDAHGVELRECAVGKTVMERLDRCGLTTEDMGTIRDSSQVANWHKYEQTRHAIYRDQGSLWGIEQFPLVVPYGLIDRRLFDLALVFWDNPDDCLTKACRRLEDSLRKRSGCQEHGAKLLRRVFLETPAILTWPGLDQGELSSRGQLFAATFGAFRNPRAHREMPDDPHAQLAEFLSVNQLFLLEREAVETAGLSEGA